MSRSVAYHLWEVVYLSGELELTVIPTRTPQVVRKSPQVCS
jgi:hypothetical protein